MNVEAFEQRGTLAIVIDDGRAPASSQERSERLEADIDRRVQEYERVTRLEHGVIQALDHADPTLSELIHGQRHELAAPLPSRIRCAEGRKCRLGQARRGQHGSWNDEATPRHDAACQSTRGPQYHPEVRRRRARDDAPEHFEHSRHGTSASRISALKHGNCCVFERCRRAAMRRRASWYTATKVVKKCMN